VCRSVAGSGWTSHCDAHHSQIFTLAGLLREFVQRGLQLVGPRTEALQAQSPRLELEPPTQWGELPTSGV
jgi:hypothetical protein